MAFEVENYSIKERLPEWWKQDLFLEPINQYTQALILEILGSLLNNLGVVQPVQVWKELPEEYNWVHKYFSGDVYLDGRINRIEVDNPIIAKMPNTKRNCHAIIKLSLLGNQGVATFSQKEKIDLTIKNGFQEIQFHDISNMADIEINTLTGQILINNIQNSDLITGSFDKIQPIAKNTNYDELNIYDENKTTQLEISATSNVFFDLTIELIKPVYATEQHIRVSTVSAFPLEWIKLYGFYCHDFNNKEGYQLVWEKTYREDSKTVYDYISTQFDFERFYVQVKFKGIGMPLTCGFPQEILPSNRAFLLNANLDKWGKIYGLPRRYYRNDISDDEEPFTFPKYYKYPVEQDYWYEERLVNEYRYNEDAINTTFIKDSDMNNIAILESIDPFINDVWVYTESILPETDFNRSTGELFPCSVKEIPSNGVAWEYPNAIKQENIISEQIIMEPLNSESINNFSYQTKELDLKFRVPELPHNIKIKGIVLRLKAETNIHSESLKIDNRSKMFLPFYYKNENGDSFSTVKEIDIDVENKPWKKGQEIYTIGGKEYFFGLENVTREQVKDSLHFKIGFRNDHDFIQAVLLIHTITAELYYEIIPDKFTINSEYNHKEIILSQIDNSNEETNSIQLKIHIKNKGKTDIHNKHLIIIVPPELTLIDNRPTDMFDLEAGNEFIMGDTNEDKILIQSKDGVTGRYDILILCDEKVIKDEILIRQGFE